jgi:hypothetical protein
VNLPLTPSSAEVSNAWSYTSTLTVCLHGVVLSLAQGQLYLYPLVIDSIMFRLNRYFFV